MSDWLLDTNVVSALMREDPRVVAQVTRLPETDALSLSVITHAEIRYGIHRMPAGRRRHSLERSYALLRPQLGQMLEVTEAVSETYARTKAALAPQGINLPENDLWIAAIALTRDLTLVTDDGHFGAVPDLRTENWLRSP